MYLSPTNQGVTLSVRVTPDSSKNALHRIGADRLGAKVKAPPVDGKANKELIRFLAKVLRVPSSSISIIRGGSSKDKVLLIEGGDPDAVREAVEGAL